MFGGAWRRPGVEPAVRRRFTMGWQAGTITMVVMLVLRVAVPLAVTFALGHALRRLDARWQAEQNAA